MAGRFFGQTMDTQGRPVPQPGQTMSSPAIVNGQRFSGTIQPQVAQMIQQQQMAQQAQALARAQAQREI